MSKKQQIKEMQKIVTDNMGLRAFIGIEDVLSILYDAGYRKQEEHPRCPWCGQILR